MKLIIIHGPPGVGKLTVASELSRKTSFKVFHNHLTIDCTKPVFDFGTEGFWKINAALRCEVIAEAARQEINIIHTFVYIKGADDKYFRELIAAAEDNGGEVHLLLLRCSNDERKKRIVNESRVLLRKLTDAGSVDSSQEQNDMLSPLPGRETLIIDNTDMTADQVALQIVEHFGTGQINDAGNGKSGI